VRCPHTHMCAYMLSEAGAVACCGWLAVYKKLSSSNCAIASESKLGGSSSLSSLQISESSSSPEMGAETTVANGRTAPPRSLRRCRVGGFGPSAIDLTTGAHQLALVLVPCQAAEPTLTYLRPPEHGLMARTGAPGALRDRFVGGFGSRTVDSGS
jgi:hypothetical protein